MPTSIASTRPLALSPSTGAVVPRHARADGRYAAAIFVSSALLFLIEPIAGKRVLPLLGGSAAVWTACLAFFQTALLVGYLLAHWLVTRLSARAQGAAYLALLALSLVQLALSFAIAPHASATHPVASVLWLLTLWIGLPFVALSATSPLLQSWYARSAHHSGVEARPYRLYAISNIGSLLALIVYPWLVEPRASLHGQILSLALGLFGLIAVSAAIASAMRDVKFVAHAAETFEPSHRRVEGVGDRMLWIALAACGSLLLSAVTSHLSQNVATIPLLWILPLIVYLLTFVIGFGSERLTWRPAMLVVAAVGFTGGGYILYKGDLYLPITRTVGVFCASLFAICLFLHSELYRRRPDARGLTMFYTCVAAGGALGAMLVAIGAPTLLSGNYELAGGLTLAAFVALFATWNAGVVARGSCLVAMGLTSWIVVREVRADRENTILQERNFYGTLHITQGFDKAYQATQRTLLHGVITHGEQLYRTDLRTEPTTYYGHASGVGLAIDLCCDARPRRIGVIGLGTGTLAAYGRPGDVIRFYDINPLVPPIAQSYFTYLRDSRARIDIVPGDARLSLAAEAPQQYDVLAVDAFSGDAIPVHLITSEALAVYRRHMKPGGIIAFHVSNRYLNLAPVVEQLAEHAGLKTALVSNGDDTTRDVFTSDWVLVTDDTVFLQRPELDKDREKILVPRGLRRWTDDYNSLLPILRFRKDDD